MPVIFIIALLNCFIFADDFTDPRDGKQYKTVQIGKKIWMAENLKYAKIKSYCYDGQSKNCDTYGRFYEWTEKDEACPTGWDLPSEEDLIELANFIADDQNLKIATEYDANGNIENPMNYMAPYLKSTSGWNKDGNARKNSYKDTYGLKILPAGYRKKGNFVGAYKNAYFWARYGYYSLNSDSDKLHYTDGLMEAAMPIRCIKFIPIRHEDNDYDDGIVALLGGGGGGIATKAKGLIKTPSERDIEMVSNSGSRSKSEIQKVVKQRTPGLRHIYNKFLKEKPGFSGKITLKFTIAPGGEIISISIVSSTTDFKAFDQEIATTVTRWKFGRVKSGNTTVTIPFTFDE